VSPVEVGDLAPDLALVDSAGRPAPLASFRGEATALIFLRHLG